MSVEPYELSTFRGKPLDELTREEAVIGLRDMYRFYEARLAGHNKLVDLFQDMKQHKGAKGD